MSNTEKIKQKVLFGISDSNIDFKDLCRLLTSFGFADRVKGSHHIFSKSGVVEIINIQPKNNKAKSYQVKQVRDIIIKYRLEADYE